MNIHSKRISAPARPAGATHRALQQMLTGLALATSAAAALAAPGTVVKATGVYAKPFLDAPQLTRVEAKAEVDILGSEGAWSQIRTRDGKTGWVRLLTVRPRAATGGSNLKGILTAGNVARTGATGSTATTGAKGISKEELAQASPNFDEVQRLESYRASSTDGRQYAAGARLTAQRVDPLPER